LKDEDWEPSDKEHEDLIEAIAAAEKIFGPIPPETTLLEVSCWLQASVEDLERKIAEESMPARRRRVREEQKARDELAAMNQVVAFMEPYAREEPSISLSRALDIENQALEMERQASGYVAPEWLQKSITLNMGPSRPRKARADVIGLLAVHPAWIPHKRSFSKVRYTLTHIPTGLIFCSNQTKSRLKDLASRLVHLDWDFDTPTGMSREIHDKAWVIFQNWQINGARVSPKLRGPANGGSPPNLLI
jgi:hypothetical protein